MTFQPGQVLLHYRIVEKIGAGGMGEVWSAEDTKLRRKVALKTLPPWTAADQRLRERFEREAQAIAALNHPNIVTAYSVEEADGVLFLTMELVDGRPLSHLLREGAVPLDELFSLAVPLTDAVAAAHERGILHRDLKPDNVMVTDSGAVKVLDFGLAKLRGDPANADAADSPTREQKVIGSAAYMSPEQAEGKAVGPTSDVFSLGILLYQMVSGRRPFSGDSSISLISSILKDVPEPVTHIDPNLPSHLGRIIRRCLDKSAARRYSTARELCVELQLLQEEIDQSPEEEKSPRAAGSKLRVGLGVASLLLAAVTVLAVAGWWRTPVTATSEVQVSQQTFHGGIETNPTLSPDGHFLAYEGRSASGGSDIFLLRVDGHNPINLTEDSDAFDGAPAFSPDGSRIAFRSNRDVGGIYVMGATGESVRRVTDFGFDPAWSPDGKRLVLATEPVDSPLRRTRRSELWVADVATGEAVKIYDRDAVQPSWSPNGHRIAFWTAHVGEAHSGQRDLGSVRSDGSDPVVHGDGRSLDWRPLWSADGRELYFASDRGGSMNIWRVGVDERTGKTQGDPRPLTTPSAWSGPFTIALGGSRMAYVVREEIARLIGVPFDPLAGRPAGAPFTVSGGSLQVNTWEASPDGEWVVFSNIGRQEDLHLVRRDGSGLRKITDDLDKDRGPSWLDDERLVFYSSRGGGYEIWVVRRDGSELQQWTATDGSTCWMPQISPAGDRLLGHNAEGTYLFDLSLDLPLSMNDARHITGTESVDGIFRGIRWSPGGRRILGTVHVGLSSTTAAIYDVESEQITPFPAPAGTASVAGDWLPDGRRFLATADGSAWVVDVASAAWSKLPIRVGTGAAKLTRDGSTLQYIDATTEADIWLARID